MAYTTSKANLAQTAWNVAATIVSAEISTGVGDSANGGAVGRLVSIKDLVLRDLVGIQGSEGSQDSRPQSGQRGENPNPGTLVINTGKYAGQMIQDVPRSYLEFYISSAKAKNEFLKKVMREFLSASQGIASSAGGGSLEVPVQTVDSASVEAEDDFPF